MGMGEILWNEIIKVGIKDGLVDAGKELLSSFVRKLKEQMSEES